MVGSLDGLLELGELVSILLEERQQSIVVQDDGAESLWVEEPDHEAHFKNKVERDDRENKVRELICDCEEPEDGPIGQPLFVVIGSRGLEGIKAHECWVRESNQVGEQVLANFEDNE